MTEPSPQASALHAYARRLNVRLWFVHAVHGLCLAAGVSALAVILASRLAEPVLTRASALAIWALVGGAGFAGLFWVLSPLRRYRGTRVAQLVAELDPALSHRLRSALELSQQPSSPSISPELQSAHIADVQRALHALPAQEVVPWSRAWQTSTWLGLLSLATFAWLCSQHPGVQSFVRALVAPAEERSDGTRIAPVFSRLRARLAFPSYLGRDAQWVDDPTRIAAPVGTTLELHITPRFAIERGRLVAGARSVALHPAADGSWTGQLTVQSDTELHIEVSKNGVRYEDPRALAIQATPDATPTVSIDEPRTGTLAPPGEVVSLRFTASDDVGVGTVQLHARVDGGNERQRQIFSAVEDGGPQRTLHSGAEVTPEELGAREGDTLVLWLEARDTDMVSGPHIGKSQEITLEVAQPGQGLSEFIPTLQRVADTAVDLLGERLETPVAKESAAARQRFEPLQRKSKAWLTDIEGLLRRAEQVRAAPLDLDQLRGLKRRNDHLLSHETGLHSPATRSFGERLEADNKQVDETERDVVLLADMLARAHVDEAKSIAEELRGLKRHIEDLLDELGKNHSPEAERELLREIAKAQRRLAELAQSLSRMATRVPSEFVNRDALHKEAAESSLTNLEQAVQDHDLRSAAQHLDALAKQIDDLASQIGQGGLRLQEERFGPRDQAMAEARQKLGILGQEQNRLSDRSAEVTRGALARGQRGPADAKSQALAPRADALGKAADELAEGQGNGFQSAAASRAAERSRDARDALKAGDLSQARGMAQSAERGLRETANELESEARMFPGREDAARRAAQARQAAADAERLTDDIDRAMPELSDHLSEGDRQKLRGDADTQQRAAETADKLKQAFDKGPDGLPLSPEASDTLDNVRKSMQRAQKALERGRPDEANREQRQAAERLQDLSKSLAEQQRGGRSGQGRKQEGRGEANTDARVHIPGTDEWKSPTELRRKLLDAMQEAGPAGYEDAIKRYYRELLR
ncbi:MAG: DUF4175 family protein [Polyangiales bacterium]